MAGAHFVCGIFQWGAAFFVAMSPMNGGPTAVVNVIDKNLRAVWPLVTLRRTPEIDKELEKVATDAVTSIVKQDSSTEKLPAAAPATPTQRRSMRQAAKLTPPAASLGVENTAKSESEGKDSKSSDSKSSDSDDEARVQVRTCTYCSKRISMVSKSSMRNHQNKDKTCKKRRSLSLSPISLFSHHHHVPNYTHPLFFNG